MGSCSNENNNTQIDVANMMDPTSYLLIPNSNDGTINSLANISATDDPFVGGPSYFAVTATTPTTNQYDHHHHHQLHQIPTSSLVVNRCELDDDDDIILGTTDLGSDSYTPGVPDGLFSSLVNTSDSGFEQFSFSDLLDVGNSPPKQLATSRTTEKRSVLMNLLVYGSDIDAGYVC